MRVEHWVSIFHQNRIMKPKSEIILRITVIALAILALFLVISLLSESNTDTGPNAATAVGLSVTVMICVSLGSWATLTGETTHKTLLLGSLILGSALFFSLYLVIGLNLETGDRAWLDYHPLAVYNLTVTTISMLALASILAVEAIAVLIHIVRTRGK
jgi:hypothetical protein